jgi:hypothetical protein
VGRAYLPDRSWKTIRSDPRSVAPIFGTASAEMVGAAPPGAWFLISLSIKLLLAGMLDLLHVGV